jgi:hypothetical protein
MKNTKSIHFIWVIALMIMTIPLWSYIISGPALWQDIVIIPCCLIAVGYWMMIIFNFDGIRDKFISNNKKFKNLQPADIKKEHRKLKVIGTSFTISLSLIAIATTIDIILVHILHLSPKH